MRYLDTITISTDTLTWNGKTKTFSQEISCLPIVCGTYRSLTVKNPKTGGKRVFKRKRVEYSNENELLAWHFESDDGLKFVIFND